MKENSREEDIILLKDFTEGNFKRDKLENYKGSYKMGYFYYKDIQQALEHILSDYKRVLKENEELKEDRKNNNEMIAFAQNELLNYMSGYEEGKKHKMTAVAQVVENQQYYIVRKQMEKYEEHIKRLQKENEEWQRAYQEEKDKQFDFINKISSNDSISVQKVKDKIKELEEELEIMKVDNMYGRYKEYGGKTKWERLFATKYGMHDALQELLTRTTRREKIKWD